MLISSMRSDERGAGPQRARSLINSKRSKKNEQPQRKTPMTLAVWCRVVRGHMAPWIVVAIVGAAMLVCLLPHISSHVVESQTPQWVVSL
jgi:hypothetical protein